MHARSILMNWKQAQRTENNIDRGTAMPTKTSVRTNSRSKVVSLQHKDLTDIPGKEGLMVAVEIAPGESVPKHRHNSDVFVYVLSGSIVTQVQGQSAKTLHAGEDSRNASNTVATRLLVFFVKDKGVPPTVYLEPHNSSTETVHYHLESSHREQA